MQLQSGTHLVIPSAPRFLLRPAEDSYRLGRPQPVVRETPHTEKRPGESSDPVWMDLVKECL
jgi:hypothetical protein